MDYPDIEKKINAPIRDKFTNAWTNIAHMNLRHELK